MSKIRSRLQVAIALVVLLSAAAATPVAAVTIRWAWVVSRLPATAAHVPAPRDQGNSTGDTNTVERTGEGRYRVTVGSVGDHAGGTVHVSPLGAAPRYCSVMGWDPVAGDMVIRIRCFDLAGARADSMFVVAFQDTNAFEGRAAYLWADEPSATAEYEPEATWSYNSTGGTNSVFRQDVGRYIAFLPGLGSDRGSVQVTTYGDVHVTCRAYEWELNFGPESVSVRCRDEAGQQVDSYFNVTFMQAQGLKGVGGGRSAYLWADEPTTASYHGAPGYRWASNGALPTVTRSATGAYTVELPGMPSGGAALVTPTGGGVDRCQVRSIRTDATPQRIGIRCYDLAGAPADTPFTLAYLK